MPNVEIQMPSQIQNPKSKLPLFTSISVLIIIFAATAAFAQEEKILPRWKWHKGDTFKYQLHGDVVATGGPAERSLVTSTITIRARDDKLALFANTYAEIRWQEKGVWYQATREGLESHCGSFIIDTAGKVSGTSNDAGKQQEFDALMPLPAKPASQGSFWTVNLPDAKLHGTCEFTGYGKRAGRNCAILKMELASSERVGKLPARELKATYYFDVEEGCFVHIERRIKTRGDKRKDERLIIELLSSPKCQSAVEKERVIIDNLKGRLKRHPDDPSIMRQLADHYARLGKLEDALGMLDRILKSWPEDAKTHTRKGELLLASGDAAAALEHFNCAYKLDKGATRALLGAARASQSLQKYDDCARYARLALGEDEKQPYQAHYLLGAALAKMKKRKAAEKALQRYIELNPNIDKTQKPIVVFTRDNDVNLVVRRTTPGVDIEKRLKYTPEELAEGRELIRALVKEESVRLRLTQEEIAVLLEYIAQAYGKKAPEMIADFLADREKTYGKVKATLGRESKLPREKLGKLAAADNPPVTTEALLSMLEPGEALKRLEALVISHPQVARYHYLLGRYYMSNPKKFGKKAMKRFELAAGFDKGNALYHYALAYASLKMHDQARMLNELATEKVDMKKLESERVPVARERLRILSQLDFARRIRKVTAWTLDDQFAPKIVKELLDAIVAIAEGFRKDDLYYWGVEMGKLAYLLTFELEKHASSAVMRMSARSARESALSVIVGLYADAGADPGEPNRKKYESELPSWREKLAKVEKESLVYLRAYVEFLKRCERAFQILPYSEPSEADRFVDRLLKGEIQVLTEEVDRIKKQESRRRGKQNTE